MTKSILTPQQKLFVLEYLVDLNAYQAALRAGYSEKTAKAESLNGFLLKAWKNMEN